MVREDLVEGAVTFLQDPSVASAPLEQRTAFLRSKNLTPEEIDASLARAGQSSSNSSQTSPPPQAYQSQYRPPQSQYGYQQQPPPYWGQPPPELPRRDWRDWFIMATVMGGVSYALYWTAKRYVYPLVAPPTPPQLEQDKASIDVSFEKAFALLDQLAADTQELKDSEKARTERLDQALSEVESVIGRMKEANETRETEAKRMGRELVEIREQIPKAIEREKETTNSRLKDLDVEMKSLKTLLANRMGGVGGQQRTSLPSSSMYSSQSPPTINGNGAGTALPHTNGMSAEAAPNTDGADVTKLLNGTTQDSEPKSSPSLPDRSASASPYGGRMLGGKASIPAWQMAAKKRSEEAKTNQDVGAGAEQPQKDTSESGTATETEAGA